MSSGRAGRAAFALIALAVPATSCSSSLPKSVGDAPVLSVATGLWPLDQAATEIGGDKAAVVDIVPPGTDPLSIEPDPSQTRILHGAGLVLEVGNGFQPGFQAAASGAPAITRVGEDIKAADPYLWLDPASMISAVKDIARAMAAANPGAAPLYDRNAGAFENEIQSIGMDYSSTLSTCPGNRIITPDGAFSAMAASYGLTDRVLGPEADAAELATARAELQTGSSVAVITEPWVDNSGIDRLAASSGVGSRRVDTLAGSPTVTVAGQDTYFAQMEHNLGSISAGLGCNPNEQ